MNVGDVKDAEYAVLACAARLLGGLGRASRKRRASTWRLGLRWLAVLKLDAVGLRIEELDGADLKDLRLEFMYSSCC